MKDSFCLVLADNAASKSDLVTIYSDSCRSALDLEQLLDLLFAELSANCQLHLLIFSNEYV